MKMIKLNFIGIFLLSLVAILLIGLPSLIIQSLWNSAFERALDRDMSIALWQAGLLWGALLSLLYMTGIFRFQIDFRSIENVDLTEIDDPELRAEIERIKALNKELRSQEVGPAKDANPKQD